MSSPDRPASDRACCPGSSRPPTRSTSATTSARCGSGSICRPRHETFYIGRRPARDHRRAGSGGAAAAHQGGGRAVAGAGHRPAALDAVRAVARAGAHPAVLGDGVHDRVRRGRPDDPVQGQVAEGRRRPLQRRAVHLPDPAGRRHPGLPGRRRPGRRGPASAPRTHPEPRAAVQLPLRTDPDGAGAVHPQGDGEDLRPVRTEREDEQVIARRIAGPARPGEGIGEEDQVRGHRRRTGDPVRREGQARRVEPALAAVGVHRNADPDPGEAVRGQGLRRPEG